MRAANRVMTRGQPATAQSACFFLHHITEGGKKLERDREGEMVGMEMGWCCGNTSLVVKSMATQKPNPSAVTKTVGSAKSPPVFPLGEKGPRTTYIANGPQVKLLTRVEQLRLLTKAEKAGLLSAAEKLGLSLSSIEKLGLLSKAEELGVLSAATDPTTPSALLTLSLVLLVLGPVFVYFVPEEYPWEVPLQAVVALACLVGGSAAFAASSFVSNLQKSN